MCNPKYVQEVFKTKEFAFDSHKLRDAILDRLSNKVELSTGVEVLKVKKTVERLLLQCQSMKNPGQFETFSADHVFNCTYSRINSVLSNSELELIPLKHEMTEMCLVETPQELYKLGLTIMCGPFFSVMPFPSVRVDGGRVVHSLSHVRYTPHYQWYDAPGQYQDAHKKLSLDKRNSAWTYMIKDAARYIPVLKECRYVKSLWEVKTVLPLSETDDSRPILCRFNYGLNGLHCIMGGKIDNVYDAIEAIEKDLGI